MNFPVTPCTSDPMLSICIDETLFQTDLTGLQPTLADAGRLTPMSPWCSTSAIGSGLSFAPTARPSLSIPFADFSEPLLGEFAKTTAAVLDQGPALGYCRYPLDNRVSSSSSSSSIETTNVFSELSELSSEANSVDGSEASFECFLNEFSCPNSGVVPITFVDRDQAPSAPQYAPISPVESDNSSVHCVQSPLALSLPAVASSPNGSAPRNSNHRYGARRRRSPRPIDDVHVYTKKERETLIRRYREKKQRADCNRVIYQRRKRFADARPRVNGRFKKLHEIAEEEAERTRQAAALADNALSGQFFFRSEE